MAQAGQLCLVQGAGSLVHGEKFKKTNLNVEWIEYRAEGHGWALPENRIDFRTRVEKFLDRHLGKP